MTKFSILIPVYNVEKYLDECVGSVLAQTYRDYELILVDDGSRDGSGRLCDTWAARDPRIRVIHQENQGLSGARNTGIAAAEGEYLMFLDSDDWWRDGSVLETVARRLERTRADVLSFSYQKIYGSKTDPSYFGEAPDAPADMTAEESAAYMAEKGLWITGACDKAIRRSLTVDHDLAFRPGIISEDVDWTMRLAMYARRFDFINQVVFLYRQRTGSISHSVSPFRVNGMCANIDECLRLLPLAPAERQEMLKRYTAYQYLPVLYNYMGLAPADRTKRITRRVKDLGWLLAWSDNPKAKLIRRCSRILGFSATIGLLRLRERLLAIRSGGTIT